MNKTRSKLEEKITQMENFASNLEEIFITVEVKGFVLAFTNCIIYK